MAVFVFGINSKEWVRFQLKDEVIDAATLKLLALEQHADTCDSYYLSCNGRRLSDSDSVHDGQWIRVFPRLPGGKGGFGSMLRAIGAQIEKTTNREACRDLSGRRLRDINEEMRLKKWIAKQTEREQEREARRKEKLERRLATPKHEFRDSNYDKERSAIPERVNNALEQGLTVAKLGEKRPAPTVVKNAPKKMRMWLGVDEDECGEGSSGDDSNDAVAGCSSWSTNKPTEPSLASATDTTESNDSSSKEQPHADSAEDSSKEDSLPNETSSISEQAKTVEV